MIIMMIMTIMTATMSVKMTTRRVNFGKEMDTVNQTQNSWARHADEVVDCVTLQIRNTSSKSQQIHQLNLLNLLILQHRLL